MISDIAILTALFAPLFLATVAVLRKLNSTSHSWPVTTEWIDDLSSDRYRPMLRLLDSCDIEFLRSQAGFSPKMEAKLRAQRCQILRGYLQCLDTDFQQVCVALKLVLLHSEQDRPDLSAVLMRQQIMFAVRLMAARFRLFLYQRGFCTVDVAPLVRIFEVLHVELRNLVLVATPVAG